MCSVEVGTAELDAGAIFNSNGALKYTRPSAMSSSKIESTAASITAPSISMIGQRLGRVSQQPFVLCLSVVTESVWSYQFD